MANIEVRPSEWVGNHETGIEARKKIVCTTLKTAYCFLLNQIRALSVWGRIISLPPSDRSEYPLEVGALRDFNSHYNNIYPYMGDCIRGQISSLPEDQNYKELFQATRDGYYELERKRLRYVFDSREADKEISGELISPQEVHRWLADHSSRQDGLIEGFDVNAPLPNKAPDITSIRGIWDFNRYLWIKWGDGIRDRDNLWIRLLTESALGKFSGETHRLATYKIACGMAIIDKLVQESANLGLPVAADYYFDDGSERENGNLLPSIVEIWHQARQMLDPDELLEPLLILEEPRFLVRPVDKEKII